MAPAAAAYIETRHVNTHDYATHVYSAIEKEIDRISTALNRGNQNNLSVGGALKTRSITKTSSDVGKSIAARGAGAEAPVSYLVYAGREHD